MLPGTGHSRRGRGAPLLALAVLTLLAAGCRDEPRGTPATVTQGGPTPTATRATTPAPSPTPDVIHVIFCERVATDAYVFERCPPGTAGNGFVTRLHVDDAAAFPMGTVIPWCIEADPGDAGAFRAIIDRPCAYGGLMRDGLRPIPALTEGIPPCRAEQILGDDPPASCVWADPYLSVMDRDRAIAFMTELERCGATLAAYSDLARLYEPVIDALRSVADGAGNVQAVDDAATPLFDYRFDNRIRPETNGVREMHAQVLEALRPALAGEPGAAPAALEVIEQAHYFYGLGRGCGG